MAQGTGLPLPKVGNDVDQVGSINADALSSAGAWVRVAAAGEKIASAGADVLQKVVHSSQVGYLAASDIADRTKRLELQDQFPNDPEGFKAAWTGYSEGKLGQADGWAANHITKTLGEEGNHGYGAALARRRAQDDKLDASRIGALATQSENDLIGHAMQGTFAAPEGQASLQKLQAVYSSAVTAGLMPQEEADRRIADISNRAAAEVIIKKVGDDYRMNRANGVDAGPLALKAAENEILRGNLPLDENQRYAYYHKATAEIHALEAERKQDLNSARAGMNDALFAMARGLKVDPAALDSIADQLSAAGGQADVAKLRAAAARSENLSTFGKLPLGDQVQQFQVGAITSRIKATPLEGALINRESGGNPTAVNRFGFAGLYQFGAPRLAELGIYTPGANENFDNWNSTPRNAGGKWTGTFNIPGFENVKTISDFLGSPEAQKAVYDRHAQFMDASIEGRGLDRFIGKTVAGVEITKPGLQAMIHLAGASGTQRVLESGGKYNPADDNGTTPLDYARLGQPTFGPGIDPRTAVGMQKELKSSADSDWAQIAKGLDEGVRPAPQALDTVIRAYTLTGNHDKLEEIGARIDRFDARASAGRQPLGTATAAATELQRVGETTGLTPGQSAWLKDLKAVNAATTTMLDSDPVRLVVERFPERYSTPAPLNPANLDNLRASLAYRASIVQFAAQNYQTPALTALSPADLRSLEATLETASADGKLAIYTTMANVLPEGIYRATMDKLGEGSQQQFIGTVARDRPELAREILRGNELTKLDKTGDRSKDIRAAFQSKIGRDLYPSAADQNNVTEAALAVYTARRGTAGTLYDPTDTAGIERAIEVVAGQVIKRNGMQVAVPPSMNGAQFTNAVSRMSNEQLALFGGAFDRNGNPFDAKFLGDRAVFKQMGPGDPNYLVALPDPNARDGIAPVMTADGKPLVIDVKQIAATLPQAELTPYQRGVTAARSAAGNRLQDTRRQFLEAP
jgi:hypothetical protein